MHDPPAIALEDNHFALSATDFLLVNPNTGTAPIFRTKRDAALTTGIYRRLPVLVDRSKGTEKKAWPLRYMTMFHMTNSSELFWTRERLEQSGAYLSRFGHWQKGDREWVRLYEGKMIDFFDHRFAEVEVDEERLFRPGQPSQIDVSSKVNPEFTIAGQYFIEKTEIPPTRYDWTICFKDVTSPTNHRTAVAALCPAEGFNHKAPILLNESSDPLLSALFIGNFNSFAFDAIIRTKLNSNSLVLFALEQIPVVPPKDFSRKFGQMTAVEIVKDHVLRLTYTSTDMAPFARDVGYIESDGTVKPPIIWNEAERRHLRARLDALYFILYGLTKEDDIRYLLSTFPIVERKDREVFDGVYLTRELILWYKRALEAGDPDTGAPEAEIIRLGKTHSN